MLVFKIINEEINKGLLCLKILQGKDVYLHQQQQKVVKAIMTVATIQKIMIVY